MVIVRIWEGLGNQLFQYAYARALQERGYEVRLDLTKAFDHSFECFDGHQQRMNSIQNYNISIPAIEVESMWQYKYLSRKTLLDQGIFNLARGSKWPFPYYEEKVQCFSDKSYRPFRNGYIKGWFQSEEYFNDIRSILLTEFRPRETFAIDEDLLSALVNENSVAIHVRRGDYVRIGMALNEIYYARAINKINEKYSKPLFCVFSDDLIWAKKHLDFGEHCKYINENRTYSDYQELYLMSKCNSFIISNSTFSWWGAWLCENENKTVIAPSKWYSGQRGIVPKKWTIV